MFFLKTRWDSVRYFDVKNMYPESDCPCFQWKPDDKLLEASKKATTKAISKNKI